MERTITQQIEDILIYVGEHYQGGHGEASIEKLASEILSLCQDNIYLCPSCHNYGIALIYNAWVGGSGNVEHRECVRCRDKRSQESKAASDILKARMEAKT